MAAPSSIFFGVEIPETLLATELQHHRAKTIAEARAMAGRSLAAKAVLLARARELGLKPDPERNAQGHEETDDEALIRATLSHAVEVDPPDEARIKAVYDADPEGFVSAPLVEASHILIAPAAAGEDAAVIAHDRAAAFIADLQTHPRRFAQIAADHSVCASASEGGSLGQLRPGDVLPEIWDALCRMTPGAISDHPVRSDYGWHILRLDHRAEGARLPLLHVRQHIAAQLEARDWTKTAAHYVDQLLAKSAASPALKLNADGGLDCGEPGALKADRLLGAALEDAQTAMQALPAEAKAAVEAAAISAGADAGDVLQGAIRRYLSSADDAAWTQLISRLRDSDEPLAQCLKVIVEQQFPRRQTAHTLISMRNGPHAAP